MSMIGLFTVAPPSTGTKAPTGDAGTAEGFGSLLQGALDELVQDATSLGEADAPPVETPASTSSASASAAAPLVELAETPASIPLVELVETETLASANSASEITPKTDEVPLAPPVEASLVETHASIPVLASTRSTSGEVPADGVAPGGEKVPTTTTLPLVELVETPAGKSAPASTGSASGVAAVATPVPLAAPVETGTSTAVPASTSSASGVSQSSGVAPVAKPVPLAAPVETGTSTAVPASTSSASGVSQSNGIAAVATPAQQAPPVETRVRAASSGVVSATSASSASGVALAAPVATIAPTQSVTPSASIAAPAPPAPLAAQLARPIFSLAAAGAGEHVMTVSVTPDNLGPVTVRAHVGPEGVRVELFAPNDLGRDAIRTIIPDLRRDLAGAGLGGNLTLSSQNQPSSDGASQGALAQQGERDGHRGTSARTSGTEVDETPEAEPGRTPLYGTTSTIDVLA